MPWAFRSHRTRFSRIPYRYRLVLAVDDRRMIVANFTLGFLTKIKKLLETVCHNCGKIKANTVSHPLRDGKS